MMVLGLISGLVGGVGVLVLLQQFAVIYPTRIATILAVVLGAVIGAVLPTIVARGGRGGSPAVAVVSTSTSTSAPPDDSVVVPEGGLQLWDEPDPAMPSTGELAAGTVVEVIDHRGDWAQVATGDGRRGWVDARVLEGRVG